MISDIQEKYDQLTQAQKDIFAGYGLRQIKHFVEISLPKVKSVLPEHTQVQGVNAEGKLQAVNAGTQQNYIWISDLQWQLRKVAVMHIDTKEDFQKVWEIFNLAQYELIDLSHIHRDFLETLHA
ncbi:hypothetical protein CDG60_06475 [Acinetobacter chinensis]|jgi:hypothetical protein|uniref:Uncharacterized protein n=1 Tax=Acinetobacter chinensis TaxID=2004650 RepID=A0A3B7LU40_9GAMM|nr:hypothetical protein [Acinetobacter chinensis]AXY56246.1 hypothetical protein CDG60_06475 [Acinetobacter chinensis]MDV2467901.1 hypothetical protein [Acinetobacter chinensis]WOE42650.1 hypothetical protein QSG87_05845 [Acinetobacter chinensis]